MERQVNRLRYQSLILVIVILFQTNALATDSHEQNKQAVFEMLYSIRPEITCEEKDLNAYEKYACMVAGPTSGSKEEQEENKESLIRWIPMFFYLTSLSAQMVSWAQPSINWVGFKERAILRDINHFSKHLKNYMQGDTSKIKNSGIHKILSFFDSIQVFETRSGDKTVNIAWNYWGSDVVNARPFGSKVDPLSRLELPMDDFQHLVNELTMLNDQSDFQLYMEQVKHDPDFLHTKSDEALDMKLQFLSEAKFYKKRTIKLWKVSVGALALGFISSRIIKTYYGDQTEKEMQQDPISMIEIYSDPEELFTMVEEDWTSLESQFLDQFPTLTQTLAMAAKGIPNIIDELEQENKN